MPKQKSQKPSKEKSATQKWAEKNEGSAKDTKVGRGMAEKARKQLKNRYDSIEEKLKKAGA